MKYYKNHLRKDCQYEISSENLACEDRLIKNSCIIPRKIKPIKIKDNLRKEVIEVITIDSGSDDDSDDDISEVIITSYNITPIKDLVKDLDKHISNVNQIITNYNIPPKKDFEDTNLINWKKAGCL